MEYLKYTTEIEKFCNNLILELAELKYTPIIINYNVDISKEIGELGNDSGEGLVTPVIITSEINTGDIKPEKVIIPGFLTQKGDEERLEIAMTSKQIQLWESYQHDNTLSVDVGLRIVFAFADTIGYNYKYSQILQRYLDPEETLDCFSELVCFYPELNELTYISKAILNSLKEKNIGNHLNAFKRDKYTGLKIDEFTIKQVSDVVSRYFNRNLEVFRTISSKGKRNALNTSDILHSVISKDKVTELSYHTETDPLKEKLGERETGNALKWLPTFERRIMNNIVVGNFPLMLYSNKVTDDSNFNSDPLNNVKLYIIQRSRMIMEIMKKSDNKKNYLSRDEVYVLDNSPSLLINLPISTMYSTKLSNNTNKAPGTVSYGKTFDLYFINFASANIVLRNKGMTYVGDMKQFMNFIVPVKL